MSVLGIGVTVVGIVALLNLLLTLAVIRRLREHDRRLPTTSPGRFPTRAILPPGADIGDFTAVDTDGRRVSSTDLTGPAVVGFFTAECAPCKALLPEFVGRVRDLGRPPWSVLAVIVVDPEDDVTEHRRLLAPVARVVVEAPHGSIQTAFGADAYPAIAIVDARGTVVASGADAAPLDALSMAAHGGVAGVASSRT
jgi:cytochrome oxidase Cu insertion factor (SCO1/SenC/PrrC family)